ncbi:N-acetylneuraminate synthase [Bacteroides cutis]|jgi:N,N'-diacetyllegionaminate synthase|uniref:N-acetylneuraminate synthase n=1 Tax=Bacteroides cutis TaxID=2024197 RepID=UPI0023A7A443|nr:N-acetylneuraminate synthase [Bacteroides cutis]
MNNHVIIIAEAGVNHNGDYELAKQLVLNAKEAGVDYVKFQTAKPELVISRFAEMAEYQKTNTGMVESQLEMCKKIHLKLEDYKPLKTFCEEVGVKFISTPFDLLSIDVLESLDMDFWKVPSGEVTNYPYLVKIANTHRPVVMSTGMCEVEEVRDAVNVLLDNGLTRDQVSLLHCNTEYPTPFEDVNLKAMNDLVREFGLKVGYSDHTIGIEVPIAAVAMGAEIIEKHFTLDHNMPGPDHKASLEPGELKAMVNAIRNIEKAMGDGKKHVSNSERKNIAVARKSIIAARDIKKGEVLTEENLTVKRPGNGINPMRWNEVVGKNAIHDFVEDELIEL